jgi:IgA-specific serine endopeptidase
MLPLVLALSLAQADPSLGKAWERRAPRDLDAPSAPVPEAEAEIPLEVRELPDATLARELVAADRARDARRLRILRAEQERRRSDHLLAEEDRRGAAAAAAARAEENEAHRVAAEERLAREARERGEKLAALEREAAEREDARLAREARRRELAVGGAVLLALAASGALVWRSLRGRQR